MTKFTHKGYIVGDDNRTLKGYKRLVTLRETKNFWISKNGNKYRKMNGMPAGAGDWPMYYLDVDTVEALEKA